MAVIIWIWGGLRATPAITDEAAYLLQAGLFARGRWSLPTPPDLAAFSQAAVLLKPVLAPKMPPGHAILLAPGMWLGLPGLVPMIMIGATVALIALLARRMHGLGVAVLAISVWLTLGAQSRWRASYMAETTTTLLWLAAWWCLLRWRDTRRISWLLTLAALCGWGAITRPLTMLVFAIPVGIVVCYDVVRLRLWHQFAAACAVGIVPLLLLPVQNAAITGNWRQSPLALYTRQYMPWDRMGFGLDSTPPQFSQGPEARPTIARFEELHREHVPSRLPAILRQRLGIAGSSLFGGWRKFLVVPALIGLVALGASGWFALGTGLLLYLGYLVYAHEAHWSIYYAEATPVEALVVAVGLQRVLGWAVGERARSGIVSVVAALMIVALGFPDLARAAHNR
ncbi:MAG: ArnT family glycosyltransferase, partial [Gemmatimonadales bacterium]